MIHSQRLACVAFALCLGAVLFKGCETGERPGRKNQNAPAADNRGGLKPDDRAPDSAVIYGITIEDADNPQKIVNTLKRIKKETGREVITRIVVDPERDIYDDKYVKRFEEVSKAGPVMVLVADSHDSYRFNDADGALYERRVRECYERLGSHVKIWEIGNEVNGEWMNYPRLENEGDDAFDARLSNDLNTKDPAEFERLRKLTGAQVSRAFRFVNGKGAKTALTLFYNEHLGRKCLPDAPFAGEYEMFNWVDRHVADPSVRDNLDYVFISFYEDDCKVSSGKSEEAVKADARGFSDAFKRLSAMFKKADVGFGEFGPRCKGCRGRGKECCVTDQHEFIERYYKKYGPLIDAPRYVGGYFYWYGLQDMIPDGRPAVNDLIRAIKKP
ncbi:MAG TPA: hypothetical protein VM936_02800 [Pyrinomonadaceae bacterium]|jgi:hypothetical protein|nr:hypothetical protein [Pyrinomonadaceae bacterium]